MLPPFALLVVRCYLLHRMCACSCHPLPGAAQHLHQLVLWAAWCWLHVVLPADEWGCRHHDGLNAAAIQAELDTAVVQQVELLQQGTATVAMSGSCAWRSFVIARYIGTS